MVKGEQPKIELRPMLKLETIWIMISFFFFVSQVAPFNGAFRYTTASNRLLKVQIVKTHLYIDHTENHLKYLYVCFGFYD